MTTEHRLPETCLSQPAPATSASSAPAPASAAIVNGEGAPKNGALKQGTAKGGAPALNGNALRHGMDSKPEVVAMRFELGSLPDPMKRVEADVYAFRRLLENAVVDAKSKIGLIDAALIQTACRHERASRLALAWLREHEEELTHAERLAYNKAIADSSAARDKTLERLKIDSNATNDPWAAYDAHMARQRAIAAQVDVTATSPNNASNAAVGVQHDGGAN